MTRRTALYRFFDGGGGLLYIGRTARFPRWIDHERTQPWWHEVETCKIEWVDGDAFTEERRAILDENPRHHRERRPVERSATMPPRVWEPLPADLRRQIAAKARKYADARTLTNRIALAMVIYKAFAHGCRPGVVSHAAGMSQEQVKALVALARKENPALPPIVSRHGRGRQAVRDMRAARNAS